MMRWFNTAGPCQPDIHYMLPVQQRLTNLDRLIAQRGYFVIHAPRQTGKTTAMLTLAQELTAAGTYTALMVSAEVGAAYGNDPNLAQRDMLIAWQDAADFWLPDELKPPSWVNCTSIGQALSLWCRQSSRPIVLFIDEIDALRDDTLITMLRQLRDGYPRRPHAFPQSLALIGLRDVRDYKVASGGRSRLGTASPFNVKVDSLSLANFTKAEVMALYAQHTTETGQQFEMEAVDLAYELTQGQPWLVNALARQLVENVVPDPTIPVTPSHVRTAKEILIQRQDTHLDSLAERLREDRVRAIIEPILAGQELGNVPQDDIQFVLDLGLCVMERQGGLAIANPIYREVLPRVLAFTPMASLPHIAPTWLEDDGTLDTEALLGAFLAFWKRHGEPLLGAAPYHEIAPHLVMMAFLHRVVNGGGTLEREYAIGRDRMDLCLRYGEVTLGIELKVQRDKGPNQLNAGLEQIEGYLDRLSLTTGWLVIFDRRQDAPPIAERTKVEHHPSPNGLDITVVFG
ncbi:MAG: ATP-binding protein [Merismopedia sp. SIO2A8]|nr:ATP-binding protein [Symploca sp. SIO2B6]NET48221.1 ATP-binding protein [Merismopedia sp. SIO2A8]